MDTREKNSLLPPHLSDAQLVAFCDGELSRAQLDSARAHMESCWSCRSRMREMQGNIDNFLQARAMLSTGESAFSELRVEQFRQRLSRHAAAADLVNPPLSGRLAGWGFHFGASLSSVFQHRKAVLALAVAVCLVAVMFTDMLNTRVSADMVLAHAEDYETKHRPASGFVTRTSIRVERIARSDQTARQLGTITLLRDSATPSIYVSAESISGMKEGATGTSTGQISPALLDAVFSDSAGDAALVKYLTAQQWFPDLSVSAFRRLADWRGNTPLSAQRDHGVFRLHCPFAADHISGIVEAQLRVDSGEYAPSGLSIFTSGADGGHEYRFTRTAFAAELRTPEIAKMFLSAESARFSIASARSLPGVGQPVPLSYANSRASESEVSIALALHQVDVCLGEEVYIFPMSDSSLLVQGLVDTPARRQSIRQALKAVAGSLRIEVYVPRELKDGSELFRPPYQLASGVRAAGSSTAVLADLSGASVPLHEILYQHFYKQGASPEDTDKQVALFSDEVVTLARQTFLHAWALKRLDLEFRVERTGGLSASALEQIEHMRADHKRWISTIASREGEMLAPIAGPDVMASVAQVAGAQDSDTLLRLAQEQNDLVRSLFTSSASQAPGNANSLSRLISVLKYMGS
jgi:hypothetical protein